MATHEPIAIKWGIAQLLWHHHITNIFTHTQKSFAQVLYPSKLWDDFGMVILK
jgi:hypothetical protein